MKTTKIFYRRMEAEKKVSELKKEVSRVNDEWKKIAEVCEHQITITTWKMDTPFGMTISDVRPRTYCLLCDENLGPKRFKTKEEVLKLRNSVNIDLQKYPSICYKWGRRCYRKELENLYAEVCQDYGNISEEEIGIIMKNRIDAIEAFS